METTLNLTPVQRFWRLLHPDRKEIRNVYVYAVFNGLINLSLPLGIQAIINLIQGGEVSTAWIVLTSVVVAGVAATGVLQIAQLRITENLQQKIFARSAFEFAFRIPRVKMEAIYKHYAPELMNRFFDTLTVQKGLSKILIDFSSAVLQVLFGLILLSFYHPFFILFSLILIILVYAIFRFTAKPGLQTSLKESKFKYKVAHWLEELARTGTTFKLAGKTELPLTRMDDEVEDYLNARESHFKILVQQYSLMVVFKALVAAGLLAMGGILVMQQLMNIGQFVAAEIIILLIMSSVEKLVMSMETIYDVITALEKIGQVTDLEIEETQGVETICRSEDCGMNITLKDVHFTYPDGDKEILCGITENIKQGESVIIMGQNGSGKSTLLQIIAGLYDVTKGQIIYNGLPKGNLDLQSLRSVIGDCLSQEQLFDGTLLDNITMGRAGATFDNVKWAIKNLQLEDAINSLPNGFDTIIDPQGKKLPKSTVRKLLLARSIADKPKLLLLEDALEHLDTIERNSIVDFLLNKENDWTIVAVSADPYFQSKADKVIYMENGCFQTNDQPA
ncbi:MAG: ABC transporter ATP-binding protein [Flavobacteriales bacterium]|nr:ABC transporter ATP-binding protein [Flavobacteriales bacterium]MCB9191928.1 ABC transporter ATP-binding protein [Flavobacteriales bacterium]